MDQTHQHDTGSMMPNPFGCVELWAGNDLVHQHVELVGLEGDVLSLPSGASEGGDLYALFSCGGQQAARVVLADCVGHGYEASRIAAHIHGLLHQHRDIRDNSRLLSVLNDEVSLSEKAPDAPLQLSTALTATFDRQTGEFNFAYAAHPKMLWWRSRSRRWVALGEGLEGLPIGAFAGSYYTQQSVRMEPDDMMLMFSDGATDVFSPDGEMLTAEGFLELVSTSLAKFSPEIPLRVHLKELVRELKAFHGTDELEDDLTLLLLRRIGVSRAGDRESGQREEVIGNRTT